jgi:hypothetical protein
MVRQSPRAPGGVVRGRRAAARSVPAWVVTSGPTAFDPTGSAPLPPAAASVGGRLNGTSSYSQSSNSRLVERKRKQPIRQRASCTQSNERSRSSVYYSPHPNLRHARACRPTAVAAVCWSSTRPASGRKIVIPETRILNSDDAMPADPFPRIPRYCARTRRLNKDVFASLHESGCCNATSGRMSAFRRL